MATGSSSVSRLEAEAPKADHRTAERDSATGRLRHRVATDPFLPRSRPCPTESIASTVRSMAVNAFVIHGPDGLVVMDGMLTVSDAGRVRRAIDDADRPLAGVGAHSPASRPLRGAVARGRRG
jgi:hypothetical protein